LQSNEGGSKCFQRVMDVQRILGSFLAVSLSPDQKFLRDKTCRVRCNMDFSPSTGKPLARDKMTVQGACSNSSRWEILRHYATELGRPFALAAAFMGAAHQRCKKLHVKFATFRSQMIVGRRRLVFAQKLRLKPVCLLALIDVLAVHLQLDR
jgi:hypothetical protein